LPVSTDCVRRANAAAVQEHLISRTIFCSARAATIFLGPHWPNAVDLSEAIGLSVNDVEDFLGEGAHKLLGIDRAEPPDPS
jgi:hypothetical protein